jgi:hypothetical protein
MFENSEIRNHVIKPFLASIGCDRLGQHPLPNIDTIRSIAFTDGYGRQWHNRIVSIAKSQGYPGGTWFYKGAKMCLIWPIWHVAFPKARWVIVRRVDDDIVYSCMRTSFMRAFKTEVGWYGWVNEHKARFDEMINAGLDVQQVWPQRIVNADFDEIKEVVGNLGLQWRNDKIIEFVTPALWSSGAIEKIKEAN